MDKTRIIRNLDLLPLPARSILPCFTLCKLQNNTAWYHYMSVLCVGDATVINDRVSEPWGGCSRNTETVNACVSCCCRGGSNMKQRQIAHAVWSGSHSALQLCELSDSARVSPLLPSALLPPPPLPPLSAAPTLVWHTDVFCNKHGRLTNLYWSTGAESENWFGLWFSWHNLS